jgi:uncharacterized membrane protein YfcA
LRFLLAYLGSIIVKKIAAKLSIARIIPILQRKWGSPAKMTSFGTLILLLVAGFLGGVANSMAGGASLFTFPALLVAGLPPIVANASNAMAVTSSNGVGFLSDLQKLPKRDFGFWLSVGVAILGGGLGAWLLLVTPEKTFTNTVPALIGFATLVFAFAKPIQKFLSRMLGGGHDHPKLRQILLFPVAIYGGYFGAGAGVIILSALNATSSMELRSLNALKNLFAFLMNMTAIVFFIWFSLIAWPQTLIMMVGTIAGGFMGIRLTKVLPTSTVRFTITACGVLMTAIYVWRYWL